jgi:hypothetical protein
MKTFPKLANVQLLDFSNDKTWSWIDLHGTTSTRIFTLTENWSWIDSHEGIQKFKFSVEIKTLKSTSIGTFCIFYCSFVLWNWDSIYFGIRFDLYFIPYVSWFSYLLIFFQKSRKMSRNLTILFYNGWTINNGIFRILVIFLPFFIIETYSFFQKIRRSILYKII